MRVIAIAGALLLGGCAFVGGSTTTASLQHHPGFAWKALQFPGWRIYLDTTSGSLPSTTRLPGLLDSARAAVLAALALDSLPETVAVFVVPNRARMKTLVGREVNGTSFHRTSTICVVLGSTGWAGVQHELTHVLAMKTWGVPERWLNEGFAVAVDGNWRGFPLHALAHYLQAEGQLPSLDVLLHRFNQTDDLLTYPAAGSFVEFLIARYGRESFRRLWADDESWATIYGKSISALEAEWLAMVRATPIGGIVYPISRRSVGRRLTRD